MQSHQVFEEDIRALLAIQGLGPHRRFRQLVLRHALEMEVEHMMIGGLGWALALQLLLLVGNLLAQAALEDYVLLLLHY